MFSIINLHNSIKKYNLLFLIVIEVLLLYLLYILINVPTSSGYEPSLYAAYPVTFWVIYFIVYLFSLSVLIYSIFVKENRVFFRTSLFNLLILNAFILLQPLLRNYFSIEIGDHSNHLAYIKEILSAHHLPDIAGDYANPYPMSHILSAVIMLFTQIDLEVVGYITPLVYYALYILFAYLLTKELYRNNQKTMLLLLFILMPILPVYFYYPSQHLFLLIPMLIYALVKDSGSISTSFRYIIIILFITLPMTHPLSSVLLLLFFVIIYLAGRIVRAENISLRNYTNTVMIFLVVLGIWAISLESILSQIMDFYVGWFSSPEEQYSYYKANIAGLQVARLSIIEAILLYIRKYGPMHILFGIAFVFSLYTIAYNWIKKKADKLNMVLSLVSLMYIIIYIISFFYTVTWLGARIYPYVLLVSILIIVSFLFNLISAFKNNIIKTVSLILFVMIIFSMTFILTFNLYSSPFNREPPNHGTRMCLAGVDWLLRNKTEDFEVRDLDNSTRRYAIYLYGHEKAYSEELGLVGRAYRQTILPHFNYYNEPEFANNFSEDCYLVINKKTELISTNIYPEYEKRWSFHPDDYQKLEDDISIDKVYHNGEIKIFYIGVLR